MGCARGARCSAARQQHMATAKQRREITAHSHAIIVSQEADLGVEMNSKRSAKANASSVGTCS